MRLTSNLSVRSMVSNQFDRVRTLLCRQLIDVRPSPHVDFHALRLLLRRLGPADMRALERILGDVLIDLDQLRASEEPSFFAKMMWILALDKRWSGPLRRRARYLIAERSFEMELDLRFAPECIYYIEDPTPCLTRMLRRGGGVFYDVGANVGFHALTGSLFFKETHAFEPTPETLTRLRRNVRINSASTLTVHPLALSSRSGEVSLRVTSEHPGENAVVDVSRGSAAAVQVKAETLDALKVAMGMAAPDLMKIDVEGHEIDVLRGAAETIAVARPTLFVEFHNWERLDGFRKLLPSGYRTYGAFSTGLREDLDRAIQRWPCDFAFIDLSRQAAFRDMC